MFFRESILGANDYFIADAYLVNSSLEKHSVELGRVAPFTGTSALSPSLHCALSDKKALYKDWCSQNFKESRALQDKGHFPVMDLEQNEDNNFRNPYLATLITHGTHFSLNPGIYRSMLPEEHLSSQLMPVTSA